jgi:uncharacterized protein YbaA (DUF1428 family)
MSELNVPREHGIGSIVELVIARVLKKDHEANLQITKQFADMVKEYGAAYFIFQLNSTDAPMEGITNIAQTVSANSEEEVWLGLIFYQDRKHRQEVDAKMQKDERMGFLYQRSLELLAPGTGFIMGEFSYHDFKPRNEEK